MLYSERHRPRGVGLAGAVHRTWAAAEKNDWQFSNPRIDTALTARHMERTVEEERKLTGLTRHELSLPKIVPAGEDSLTCYASAGAKRIK